MKTIYFSDLKNIADWNNAENALLLLSFEEKEQVEKALRFVGPSTAEELFGRDIASKAFFEKAMRDGLLEKKEEEAGKFSYYATLSWFHALKWLLDCWPVTPTIIRRRKRIPVSPKKDTP